MNTANATACTCTWVGATSSSCSPVNWVSLPRDSLSVTSAWKSMTSRSTVKELRDKGIEVSEPKLGKDRSWQAWITDPDGNRIELHDYNPDSKQTPYVK